MQISFDNVTQYIAEADVEDQDVINELFELLYAKIKQLADIQLRKLNPNESIHPTQLVHECYIKLTSNPKLKLKDRNHFYSLAARSMRFYLVDQIRSALNKKNKGIHTELKLTQFVCDDEFDVQLLDLDRMLEHLHEINPELANITELKFFGGFTFDEIADIKNIPRTNVFKKWSMAKSFLMDMMSEDH